MGKGEANPAEQGGERRAKSEILWNLNVPTRSRLLMRRALGSSRQTGRQSVGVRGINKLRGGLLHAVKEGFE